MTLPKKTKSLSKKKANIELKNHSITHTHPHFQSILLPTSQTRPSPAPSPRDNGIQLVASAALHSAAVAPSQESRLEVLARDRPHRVAGNDHDLGRRLGRGSPRRRLAEVWARARRREGDLTLLFVARLPALRRFLVRGALPRNGGATPEHGLLVEAERSLPRRLRRSRLGPLKVSLVERGRASTWMLPRRWRAEIFLDREARPGTGSAAPAALPAPEILKRAWLELDEFYSFETLLRRVWDGYLEIIVEFSCVERR